MTTNCLEIYLKWTYFVQKLSPGTIVWIIYVLFCVNPQNNFMSCIGLIDKKTMFYYHHCHCHYYFYLCCRTLIFSFFFLKIKMLYNINTTFKKKEKFNVLQHKWKNSGSDDGCDDIIYLSINPKDDMKLFCGFTQNST